MFKVNHMVEYNVAGLDRTFAALADPTRRALIARLRDKPDLSISELAQPHRVTALAQLGAKMTAIDVAPTFIANAASAESDEPLGIEFRVADAGALPFANGSFDFAVAFMSFNDSPD